jgi:hypothetical protein
MQSWKPHLLRVKALGVCIAVFSIPFPSNRGLAQVRVSLNGEASSRLDEVQPTPDTLSLRPLPSPSEPEFVETRWIKLSPLPENRATEKGRSITAAQIANGPSEAETERNIALASTGQTVPVASPGVPMNAVASRPNPVGTIVRPADPIQVHYRASAEPTHLAPSALEKLRALPSPASTFAEIGTPSTSVDSTFSPRPKRTLYSHTSCSHTSCSHSPSRDIRVDPPVHTCPWNDTRENAYYFHPYQYSDIAQQQAFAPSTRMSNPYDNRFFSAIQAQQRRAKSSEQKD